MKKLLTICFILIHTWSLASNNDQAPWYIVQISDPQLGFIEKNKSIEQETILLKKAIQKINSLQPEILLQRTLMELEVLTTRNTCHNRRLR